MELPTLFQRDSKGKVRQWRVWTEGDTIVVEHGIQDGKLQEKRTKAKPKNVGKVNATTAEEQALLEAQSKWTAQVDREDYNEDVEQAGLQTRPMLAHDYHKVPHRVNWDDAVAQPKLDGLRLAAGFRWKDKRWSEHTGQSTFEMMTRKGEVHNVDHLMRPAELLLTIVNEKLGRLGFPGTCIAIDGEVYLHGLPLQTIASRSKKYYPGETEKLEFHVFDLVAPGLTFELRYKVLKECFQELQDAQVHGNLVLVPTLSVSGLEELRELHGMFIEGGYEGAIIRHKSGLYKLGDRSADLFKYKEFKDEECQIIEVWEDLNHNAMLTVVRKNGVEVDVTPKRTHEERRKMLTQGDLKGRWIKVKYQAETPDGSLQFPVGLEIRDCDDNGEPLV